jgi:hypothetical protein
MNERMNVNKDDSKVKFLLCQVPADLLLGGSASRISRERSGELVRSFSLSVSFHHGSQCSYITWGINIRLDGGPVQRGILTPKIPKKYKRTQSRWNKPAEPKQGCREEQHAKEASFSIA